MKITEIAIKGNGYNDYGKKIINFFESHNVKNKNHFYGNSSEMYYYACENKGELILRKDYDKPIVNGKSLQIMTVSEAKSRVFNNIDLNFHYL